VAVLTMGVAAKRAAQPSSSPSPSPAAGKAKAPEDAADKKSSFLVTSPGFGRQLLANLAVISAFAALCVYVQPLYEVGEAIHGFVTEQMMHGAQRMAWWSVLGLLSSSCCALQIMLNAFSFGCAGFNTTLGPWRPTFVALTITVQTISWCVAYGRPYQWMPTAAATCLSLVLTMLPEVLALHTARRERLAAAAAVADPVEGQRRIQLQLESLGCSACVEKVSSVLGPSHRIQSYSHCSSCLSQHTCADKLTCAAQDRCHPCTHTTSRWRTVSQRCRRRDRAASTRSLPLWRQPGSQQS
jgi:hypothetical protein